VFALATFGAAQVGWANNGLSLIGTGAVSVAMGGADVAVARDTSALSTNPAGLTQLAGWAFDGILAAAFALDVAHADRYGNDQRVANWIVPNVGAGVSKRIEGSAFTLGIGLFGQAGAGNVYNNLNTPFGGQDTLRSQFGVLKLTPGVAWQPHGTWALGATLNVHYALLNQRVFPNQSVATPGDPAQAFFGTAIHSASAIRVGTKLGVLYRPTEALSFGLAYSPQVNLPLKGKALDVNLSALGLGRVTYRDVRLDGLALPQELAGGVAWQATPRTLVALDVKWQDNSRALRAQTLSATSPDDPRAPPTISSASALDWRDQVVIATGLAYEVDESTNLYAGINYGRNPAPAHTLSPLFAGIGELHVTGRHCLEGRRCLARGGGSRVSRSEGSHLFQPAVAVRPRGAGTSLLRCRDDDVLATMVAVRDGALGGHPMGAHA
jgi:long-chain fatty acid transport protein